MLRHWTVFAVALTLCGLAAAAEGKGSGEITSVGHVLLHPKITKLRFTLTLLECGDDMEQVQKNLAQKGEACRKALLAANATPNSVQFDAPELSVGLRTVGELEPTQSQSYQTLGKGYQTLGRDYQRVKAQAVPQSPGPASTPAQGQNPSARRRKPRIALTSLLTAEWPLQETTPAKLLIEADNVVVRVREQLLPIFPEKDLTKSPPPPAKGQTIAPVDSDSDDNDDACQPFYLFVGVLSEEQLKEAKSKAFKDAMANAEEKAEVVGLHIGSVATLEVTRSRLDSYNGDSYPSYSSDTTPPPLLPASAEAASAKDGRRVVEITSLDPSRIFYWVNVNATFQLQLFKQPNTTSK